MQKYLHSQYYASYRLEFYYAWKEIYFQPPIKKLFSCWFFLIKKNNFFYLAPAFLFMSHWQRVTWYLNTICMGLLKVQNECRLGENLMNTILMGFTCNRWSSPKFSYRLLPWVIMVEHHGPWLTKASQIQRLTSYRMIIRPFINQKFWHHYVSLIYHFSFYNSQSQKRTLCKNFVCVHCGAGLLTFFLPCLCQTLCVPWVNTFLSYFAHLAIRAICTSEIN